MGQQAPLLYRGKDGTLHAPPGYQLVSMPPASNPDANLSAADKIDQSIMMILGDGTQPSTTATATAFYQHQTGAAGPSSQKMYRVVMPPSSASTTPNTQDGSPEVHLVHPPSAAKRKRLSVGSRSSAIQQQSLVHQQHESILIDGNSLVSHPQTLVIEQGDRMFCYLVYLQYF